MKIYPEKLSQELKKHLLKLYIVSGDEPLLVQEAADLVREACRSNGFTERELFHAEGNFDWTSLLYSVGSMSLFAEKKLMEVRMPTGKPGDQGSRTLVELAGQLSEDTVLLLVLPRATQDIQRTKWFKRLEAEGGLIQVWPIEPRELPRWLDGRFRRAGLKATREAVQLMAERIEGNLLAGVQEIERLRLIANNHQVDVQDVIEGVADSARYDVFKLIDAALVGDAARCVRMTDGLQAEGVELMFIINMLVRELRSLESMKTAIEAGESRQSVLKKARVWKNREAPVSRCLERHTLANLRGITARVGQVDRMVKGIEAGDPWRQLQDIVLELAGRPITPPVSAGAGSR